MITYCPECDARIELMEVDGYDAMVCPNCSKLTTGYPIEHQQLIIALRGAVSKGKEWQVRGFYLAVLEAGWRPA